MKTVRIAVLLLIGVLLGHTPVWAQDSSWGVSGSIVPTWTVPGDNPLFKMMFGADSVDIAGSEFRIGFVRGRMLSGDWGVSFVRRKLKDGSTLSADLYTDPQFPSIEQGEFITLRNVEITGVEVHKFSPFGTIKERVQIGLLFAGGVGSAKGQLESRTVEMETTFVGNRMVGTPRETREMLDAKELIFPGSGLVPLGRLELAVAALAAPGFKVRVSGGISFPGMHTFSVSGVYLIGAH